MRTIIEYKKNHKNRKKGFTMVELVVVLVIMGIILAIAIPSFIHYWRMAEFRKNEENAKTVYLAAESKMTYYRSSGQWKELKKQIQAQGMEAPFDEPSLKGRIYGVTLDAGKYGTDGAKDSLVTKIIDDYMYDKSIYDGSIAIEIDIQTGEVYSAFYGTKCKGLNYESEDKNDYLTMNKRSYDERKSRLLGYYSTKDTGNVVELDPKRLRITTISLNNGETLSLDWSSNAPVSSQDVDYELTFYKDNGSSEDKKLFSTTFSPKDMVKGTIRLNLKNGSDKDAGQWDFPIVSKDNKFSLVLDGMMSSYAQKALDANRSEEDRLKLLKTSSTSITRLSELGGVQTGLNLPEDIYAEVKAVPNNSGTSGVEYRPSEKATSNTSNSMFATTSSGQNEIALFRHLSNIRYYQSKEDTTFTVTSRNMNWKAVGTGVYELQVTKEGNEELYKPVWTENTDEKAIDFPTIQELPSNYTLTGRSSATTLSNLVLGEQSIVTDEKVEQIYQGIDENNYKEEAKAHYDHYVGLFGEASGTIKDFTIEDAILTLGSSDKALSGYGSLTGAGILAGRSDGNISNVSIETSTSNKTIVNANLSGQDQAAIGGLIGSYSAEKAGAISKGTIDGVSVSGKIEAKIKEKSTDEASDHYSGIGGLVGYAHLDNISGNATFDQCNNHADVEGNQMTGGIVGKLVGAMAPQDLGNDKKIEDYACIKNSENDGLITSSKDDGTYFGGIVGYGNQALIHSCSAASGRSSSFVFSSNKKNLLKGNYVGGIIGYGTESLLNDCSTKRNGYVLGNEQVGGIAGAMEGNMQSAITSVAVTTNASYVVGNKYVGGIVGKNENQSTIKDCVNNGVAAGYKEYVGGIAGSNEEGCKIEDCASYLSDYSGSVYSMIVNLWETSADCSGGITGYNDGEIKFDSASEKITVKSISSIVVGKNYVGGIAGYNDKNGILNVHYTLIGGRIYASGKAVGGAFGLNASEDTLNKELSIKPRSVQGKYYVGGIIGANVVNLKSDTTISKYKADNILGTITGEAFVGGIIGYHRSVREDINKIDVSGYLPEITGNNTPGNVASSTNTHTLTLTTAGNRTTLSENTNNIPIRAYLYAGGIVGYANGDSKLVIKNCKNAGNISSADGIISSNLKGKEVFLKAFIADEITGRSNRATDDSSDVGLHMAGGIISVNLNEHVIDHCANRGSLSGFSGIGGIVGLNAGGIFNCELTDHFGNANLNYVGGIAGVNVGAGGKTTYKYTDTNQKEHDYQLGTIADCDTQSGKTISGHIGVGGITGWNYTGGVLKDNTSKANIRAYANLRANELKKGQYIGGVAGRNDGTITVANDQKTARTVAAANCDDVGGIVGCNESNGALQLGADEDIVAVESEVTVTGASNVGGIVGKNHGNLGGSVKDKSIYYLVSHAKEVRASEGTVGGIVGTSDGNIQYVKNHARVIANKESAGGITAINGKNCTISNAINDGDVRSSKGHAGGIVAENNGIICESSVESAEIYSLGEKEIGAIAAVNGNTGTIKSSEAKDSVTLSGNSTVFGGIVGTNRGTVQNIEIYDVPKISSSSGKRLTFGGIVGINENKIDGVRAGKAENGKKGEYIKFLELENETERQRYIKNCEYIGIIAGENGTGASNGKATITNSDSAGAIAKSLELNYGNEARAEATKLEVARTGSCYGGIAGVNWSDAEINDCRVESIIISITGVYTATSTSDAGKKEQSSTHVGGVTGKNAGNIKKCTLQAVENEVGTVDTELLANNGMVGGIAGYNKGTIEMSGDVNTAEVIQDTDGTTSETMQKKADDLNIQPDTDFYSKNGNNIYTWGTKAIKGARFYMKTNGNIGGITAYNSPTGKVQKCMSGKWLVSNQSNTLGVGAGGIIGMNESENDSTYLFNRSFVERQISTEQTNRFAGGIIGNQNNSTTSGWNISHCVNYGCVYCLNTHYSGGIIGQWTGNGGNIEDCRNYGNLFTTTTIGWLGASAGIVAQLYHANADNEYNIISCRNYGSIYGAKKDSIENCANDSAGILGNVTAYRIEDEKSSPKYNIQVLDCVNESGVVIYSNSMASGIVGFFSADDVEKMGSDNTKIEKTIIASTANIELRIERCQNYATRLYGRQFVGGIFGDRYGDKGCQKTTVKDCYSVNSSNYSKQGFPIYSFKNGKGNASYIAKDNKSNNYFAMSGKDSLEKTLTFTDVKITEEGDANKGSGDTGNSLSEEEGYVGGSTQYANYFYIMYDQTIGKYFVARIYPKNNVFGAYAYITKNGYIKAYTPDTGTDGINGQVLFYLDKNYPDMNSIVGSGSKFSELARESYRRLEGIIEENGKDTLLDPKSATASVSNGKIKVEIIPQDLLSKDGTKSRDEEKCDPFEYQVYVTSKENFDPNSETIKESDIHKIYTESGDFNIPKEVSGEAKIWVRAVSMYDDVTPSKWIEAGGKEEKEILPTPEPRLELIYKDEAYKYRLKLENKDDYKEYPGWQVTIKVGSLKECTLNANKLEEEMEVSEETTCQIVSYAYSPNNAYEQSATSSEQAFIPVYRPRMTVNNCWKWTDSLASPEFEVTGTNLDDLGIQVTLDASATGLIENPPIYRAELVGTWKGKENVVFAKTDMLTSSGGKTVANFTNLPEYLGEADNLRVRLWYAESGLGPVYTYREFSEEDDKTIANIAELTGVENDKDTYQYSYSTVLANEKETNDNDSGKYFGPYIYDKEDKNLIEWLVRPDLDHVEDIVDPTTTDNKYTFTWDTSEEFNKKLDEDAIDKANLHYEVELTGITETGEEVSIDTSEAYTDDTKRILQMDGADWNYSKVKLKVTRKGGYKKKEIIADPDDLDYHNDETPTYIGLSSTGTYKVKQRLSTPSQPTVELIDTNELNYRITWDPIDQDQIRTEDNKETNDCEKYEVRIEGEKDPLLEVPANGNNKQYVETVNLEKYQGREITIYLVAVAEKGEDSSYIDSADGIGYTFTVPERLPEPKVEWKTNWTYDRNNPLSESKFENGDMSVSLTAQNNDSIPTSGGGYILKAYVYKSQAEAEEALKGADHKNAILEYPTGSDSGGVVEMTSSSQKEYFHDLEGISIKHAGQWIVFQARLSAGSGNVSSVWTYSEPYQLPYVKLSKANVVSDTKEYTQEVVASTNSNPDIPNEKETQDWTATNRILEWDSVKSADVFELALTGTNGSSTLRVVEDQENKVVRVEVKDKDGNGVKDENGLIWNDIGEITPEFKTTSEREEWENDKKRTRTYQIDAFKKEISKNYESNGENTNYSLISYAQLEVVPNYKYDSAEDKEGTFTGFSYTLKLPDMEKLVNASGRNVMASLSDEDKKDFMPTTQVDITANVEANLDGKTSEKYVPADTVEVKMEQN